MKAKAMISGEEVRQLATYGIDVWAPLAEGFGVTMQKVQQMAERRMLDVNKAMKIILASMHEEYGGQMVIQANTIKGIWSNIKDYIYFALKDIGNSIIAAFDLKTKLNNATEAIGRFVDWFKKLDPEIKKTAANILLWVIALGPVVFGIGKVIEIFGLLYGPVAKGVIGFGKLLIADFTLLKAAGLSTATAFAAVSLEVIAMVLVFKLWAAVIKGYSAEWKYLGVDIQLVLLNIERGFLTMVQRVNQKMVDFLTKNQAWLKIMFPGIAGLVTKASQSLLGTIGTEIDRLNQKEIAIGFKIGEIESKSKLGEESTLETYLKEQQQRIKDLFKNFSIIGGVGEPSEAIKKINDIMAQLTLSLRNATYMGKYLGDEFNVMEAQASAFRTAIEAMIAVDPDNKYLKGWVIQYQAFSKAAKDAAEKIKKLEDIQELIKKGEQEFAEKYYGKDELSDARKYAQSLADAIQITINKLTSGQEAVSVSILKSLRPLLEQLNVYKEIVDQINIAIYKQKELARWTAYQEKMDKRTWLVESSDTGRENIITHITDPELIKAINRLISLDQWKQIGETLAETMAGKLGTFGKVLSSFKSGGVIEAIITLIVESSKVLADVFATLAEGVAAIIAPIDALLGIIKKVLGPQLFGAAAGAGIGYLIGGPIGAVVGAIAGLLGSAAKEWKDFLNRASLPELAAAYGQYIEQLAALQAQPLQEWDPFDPSTWGDWDPFAGMTTETEEKLREILAKMQEILQVTAGDLAQAVSAAFSTNTAIEFTAEVGKNLYLKVRGALIQAFMESAAMMPLFQALSDAIALAVMDGVLSAVEMAAITAIVGQIQGASTIFFNALDAAGLGLDDLTQSVNAASASIRNAPSGFKYMSIKWMSMLPEYATGTDFVPRTGPAILHQGEQVTPAGEGGGDINLNFYGPVYGLADFESQVISITEKHKGKINSMRGYAMAGVR